MRSRNEVSEIFQLSEVPTVELRAAIIIGSGSASFEMTRYLTERLPAMVTPAWVRTPTQPIAIRDVLYYLVRCADLPPGLNRAFDIGGPDVMTYELMMHGYARAAGLRKRLVIRMPLGTPGLSSFWVGLITPVPRSVAKPLVESVTMKTVCRDHDIAEFIPDPPEGLVPYERAVELALNKIQQADVRTAWSNSSLPGAPSDPLPSDPSWAGGSLYLDERSTVVHASPAVAVAGHRGHGRRPRLLLVPRGLGGARLDGPRRRRRRAAARTPRPGPAAGRRPARLLAGRGAGARAAAPAARRVPDARASPGSSSSIRTEGTGRGAVTVYTQRALFHPKGLYGHAYWTSMLPFHGVIFGSMLRNIRESAEELERSESRALGSGEPVDRAS